MQIAKITEDNAMQERKKLFFSNKEKENNIFRIYFLNGDATWIWYFNEDRLRQDLQTEITISHFDEKELRLMVIFFKRLYLLIMEYQSNRDDKGTKCAYFLVKITMNLWAKFTFLLYLDKDKQLFEQLHKYPQPSLVEEVEKIVVKMPPEIEEKEVQRYIDKLLRKFENEKPDYNLPTEERSLLEHAFYGEALIDPSKEFRNFVSYSDKTSQTWDDTFYAPYNSIVNGSMMGKSKYLYELGKRRFMIFCCLRKTEAGIPMPTPHIKDFLLQRFKNRDEVLMRFCAYQLVCLRQLTMFIKEKSQDRNIKNSEVPLLWLKYHYKDDIEKFWKNVCDEIIELEAIWREEKLKLDKLITNVVKPEFSHWTTEFQNAVLFLNGRFLKDKDQSKNYNVPCNLFYAYDEAETLLKSSLTDTKDEVHTNFYYARLALAAFPYSVHTGVGILAYFVDTSSSVPKFSPADAKIFDNSLRLG